MQSVNEIIEAIHSLPKIEQEKIGKILEKEKLEKQKEAEDKSARLKYQLERYKKAKKWLAENSEKYMNKWVCLEGDRLIAVSDDGRDLYQKAKEAGIEIPFIHHIVEEPKFFAGGGYELIRD